MIIKQILEDGKDRVSKVEQNEINTCTYNNYTALPYMENRQCCGCKPHPQLIILSASS